MAKPGFVLPTWYPKPGPVGGSLIREVIAFLREQGCILPINSHILIALSGGTDSLALAHLLVRYGRKIIDPKLMTLLHINHGWRGKESDGDEDFVQGLAHAWGVRYLTKKLEPPCAKKLKASHLSWEEAARLDRKRIFQEEAKKLDAKVWTAHQSDDLAETFLWRICSGAARTHAGGIAFEHGVEVRPLLKIRKSTLKRYLEEVGLSPREDSTNHSDRFLRARMRKCLMPELERIFPKAVDHFVSLALNAQKLVADTEKNVDLPHFLEEYLEEDSMKALPYEILFQAAGLKARRSHLEYMKHDNVPPEAKLDRNSGVLQLPGGWKLVHESQRGANNQARERWVLEQI
jgi:tRNA(Ile)-lysidine synthase